MNKNFIKLLIMILSISLCVSAFAACDGEENDGELDTTTTASNTTKAPDGSATEEPDEPDGDISKDEWNAKFSEKSFENYTVIMEGIMSVTQNGLYNSTSNVWQKVKITADKIEITARGEDMGSSASDEFTLVFDGEVAASQKEQNAHIFMLILKEYDSFIYDSEKNAYIIVNPVIIDEVVQAIKGDGTLFDAPSRIEFREAVVTFSDNGMIATLTCDYSQTLDMGDEIIVTSGKTTWTFTDFGATVIE